jgi:hypothetical protein
MPVRGQGEAEAASVLLVAVRGRESVARFEVAVEAAGSASSGEERLHAVKAAKATRSGPGRFLIESQR